jgi:predicted DNA-binding transcriptional regulator YafY
VRRADRLFRIVQYLRGRRLTTAQQLATWLQVSERTIYRDIADLSLSGTPIEGERGIGYRLRGGNELPPLMFEESEVEALTLGARMVEVWSGPRLASAATAALAKIATALPKERRAWLDASKTFVPQFHTAQTGEKFEQIRAAIHAQHKLRFVYAGKNNELSARTVRPISLHFWGAMWTLSAWCESDNAMAEFQIDRMMRIEVTNERFRIEAGMQPPKYR